MNVWTHHIFLYIDSLEDDSAEVSGEIVMPEP